MDKRQLQVFHSVVKEGSFTKAANALNIAQSAVSVAIRKLEQELGSILLNRSDRKVTLTAEGARLFVHAEKIIRQFQQAVQEITELSNLQGGQVRLGTPAMLGSYYLPEKIAAFRKLHPNINVQISGEGTRRSQQLILSGEIDMGVITMDNIPEALEVHGLEKEEVVACVSPRHRFAEMGALDFSSFVKEPLVVYREGYYLRELIARLSEAQGIEPKIAVETDLLRLMVCLVQEDLGLGFCVRRLAETEPEIVGIPFKQPIYLEMGIAWKRNQYLSKANRCFVDFLLQ